MIARKLILAAATAGIGIAFASAPAAHATDVCNEAQSSWKGVYTVTDNTDPNPPARHKDAAMKVGNGKGKGLVNAAEHSPALAVCGPDDGGSGDGGPAAG